MTTARVTVTAGVTSYNTDVTYDIVGHDLRCPSRTTVTHLRHPSCRSCMTYDSDHHDVVRTTRDVRHASHGSTARVLVGHDLLVLCPNLKILVRLGCRSNLLVRSEVSFRSDMQICFKQLYSLLLTKIRLHIRFAKRI